MVWVQFLACLGIILFSGTKLAHYGDAISEKTKLGGVWVGMVLLAVITSAPEVVTSISSATLVGSSDMALGTLFGSNLFNLAILALLDVAHPVLPILSVVRPSLGTLAWGVVVLTGIASIGIVASETFASISLGWVAIPSLLLVFVYLYYARRASGQDKNYITEEKPAEEEKYNHHSMKEVWVKFTLASLAIVGASIWLSLVGDQISGETGLGESFVGSLFLAVSTSAPELVVAFAALRMGSVDMAVADILGSNLFNIAMIFLVDIATINETIFSKASDVNLITAGAGILMVAIVLLAMKVRSKRKELKYFSWYVPILFTLYIGGFYFLYRAGIA